MLQNSIKQIIYIQAKTIILFLKSRKLIKNASSKKTTELNRQHRTEQKTKYLRTRRGSLPVKFLTTPNELGQKNRQLNSYKNNLLTGNWYKNS